MAMKRKNLRASSSDTKTRDGQKKQKKSSKNEYLEEVLELKSTIDNWDNLFSESADETRMSDWLRIEVLGEPLLRKYAWAIPDEKALNIIRQFSPIVEMGAGKGYWAHLLKGVGVDVISYDIELQTDSWSEVLKGDPSVLSSNRKLRHRTLFLCYPDEGCAMGQMCLDHIDKARQTESEQLDKNSHRRFIGDYIIHVGELIHTGCASGAPQAPWGRSTAPDFQVKLSEQFHLVLATPLVSFPFSRDFLTVWKRTRVISMAGVELAGEEEEGEDEVEDASEEDDEEESEGGGGEGDEDEDKDKEEEEEGDEGEDEDQWADVSCDERIFGKNAIAVPAYDYLLNK